MNHALRKLEAVHSNMLKDQSQKGGAEMMRAFISGMGGKSPAEVFDMAKRMSDLIDDDASIAEGQLKTALTQIVRDNAPGDDSDDQPINDGSSRANYAGEQQTGTLTETSPPFVAMSMTPDEKKLFGNGTARVDGLSDLLPDEDGIAAQISGGQQTEDAAAEKEVDLLFRKKSPASQDAAKTRQKTDDDDFFGKRFRIRGVSRTYMR